MMQLSEIWIYPVKSLGGIRLGEANAEERGLQYDRRWVIVDETGKFITQRAFPEMAFIDITLTPDGLQLWNRQDPQDILEVPFDPETNETIMVNIWDDTVPAVRVSDEADSWLSRQLGNSYRLMVMPESTRRHADPKYARNGEIVSFADGYPFMLISQASLDDLNSRLEDEMIMRRFRPNFVVTGSAAFEEDQWKSISIGDTAFDFVKPCARCVLTTIDPDTAEKGAEPLKTLAQYRRLNNKIMFGQNAVATKVGTLKVGDIVEVMA